MYRNVQTCINKHIYEWGCLWETDNFLLSFSSPLLLTQICLRSRGQGCASHAPWSWCRFGSRGRLRWFDYISQFNFEKHDHSVNHGSSWTCFPDDTLLIHHVLTKQHVVFGCFHVWLLRVPIFSRRVCSRNMSSQKQNPNHTYVVNAASTQQIRPDLAHTSFQTILNPLKRSAIWKHLKPNAMEPENAQCSPHSSDPCEICFSWHKECASGLCSCSACWLGGFVRCCFSERLVL